MSEIVKLENGQYQCERCETAPTNKTKAERLCTCSDEYREADQYVYVRARSFEGADRKMPIPAWVNNCPDGIDPRSLENPHTLPYEETEEETPYIIVGARDGHMLDIDIDIGDGHDETFCGDIEEIRSPRGVLAFNSASGGPHRILKFDREHSGFSGTTGVDLQGDMTGNMGVVTSPFHHPDYEIVSEPTERVTFDEVFESDDANLNTGFGATLLEEPDPAPQTRGGEGQETIDDAEAGEKREWDEHLTHEDLEEALSYIPRDLGYKEWRKMAYAVHDFDPSAEGRELFADWSREGARWDTDSQENLNGFWEHADAGPSRDPVTLGSLIQMAELRGWERPARPSTDSGLPAPEEFVVHDGGYGRWDPIYEDGELVDREWVEWTNFQLETVEFLFVPNTETERRVTVRVHPSSGEDTYEVTIPTTTFNDAREFRDRVVIGHSTTFERGGEVLNKIRRFVAAQDAPHRTGVEQLGLFGLGEGERTEWVTADGALTADGWADEPAYVYDGRGTAIERSWSLAPEDGDEIDREAVREALRLLPRTRLSDRFLPVLGWFYAAPLRPYIMRWEGEFNNLSVTGDSGAGKTTTLQTLSQLFGLDGSLLSASSTKFAVMSAFASTNAAPVIFDEYKPATMADFEVQRFNEFYRKNTRDGVETRGRPDFGEDTFPLRAPVAVAGEQAVRGAAEQRRTILAEFSSRAAAKHSDTRHAFAELAGLGFESSGGVVDHYDGVDPKDHALAYYRFVLGLEESDLRESWHASEERVRRVLDGIGNGAADEVRDAEFQALQTVAFGVGTYRAFADEYGLDVTDNAVGVTDDELDGALRRLVTRGDETRKRNRRSSHTDKLLGLIATAAAAEYIEEGEHYAFVREGDPNELLCFRLTETFHNVRRYARDHDLREDLFDEAADYRRRFRDAAETDGSVVDDMSKQVGGLNRSIAIHVGRAMESVDGFDRDMFGDRAPNKHLGYGVDVDQLAEANEAADRASQQELVDDILDTVRNYEREHGNDTPTESMIVSTLEGEGYDRGRVERQIETMKNGQSPLTVGPGGFDRLTVS